MDRVPTLSSSSVAAHARHSVVRFRVENLEFIVICCSRSQYSHIRGVSRVSTVTTRYNHTVTTRVYRACHCVVVGFGLAMKY